MQNPAPYPQYRLPRRMLLSFAVSWLLRRRRSFRQDALQLLPGMNPPPCVHGQEHIPQSGPCLLVTNHYKRPDFPTWWLAIAFSAVIPAEITWVTTLAWRYPRWSLEGLVMGPLMRLILRMIADVYGFIRLPPNPPMPEDAVERAIGVRQILTLARSSPALILGLTPEGRDFPEQTLGMPPPGGGRMMLHLAQMGLRVVPAAVYEQDGCLHLHFGAPLRLTADESLTRQEIDACVSRQVMQGILSLLPPGWRLEGAEAPGYEEPLDEVRDTSSKG